LAKDCKDKKPQMEKRELGQSGLWASPLAFGGNVFGWTVDKKTGFELLDAFSASGFNLVDTADVYSTWVPGNQGGESETMLGEWMHSRKKREALIIATKVGKPMGPDKKGLSRKYIREAVEASLKRLQTTYIDLYQSHDDDASVEMEETLETFSDLIKEGKVRAIGASNFSAERLSKALEISRANGYARYETFQPPYNLYDRSIERDVQPLCVKEKIGIIPYYSLASGFLTGKYRSEKDVHKSVRGKSVLSYLDEKGMQILKALDWVAARYHASAATIALAWLMARPGIVAPIASATTVSQLKDLCKATEIRLGEDDMRILSLEETVGVG
jgi:aryl-alcohol dehydrogenase-like predicted oxidoreductase